MLRLLFDWTILVPAKLLATVVAPLLFLLPLLAGFAAWLGVATVMENKRQTAQPALATMVVASLVAMYVFMVVGGAITDLPAAISKFLKMAD